MFHHGVGDRGSLRLKVADQLLEDGDDLTLHHTAVDALGSVIGSDLRQSLIIFHEVAQILVGNVHVTVALLGVRVLTNLVVDLLLTVGEKDRGGVDRG